VDFGHVVLDSGHREFVFAFEDANLAEQAGDGIEVVVYDSLLEGMIALSVM